MPTLKITSGSLTLQQIDLETFILLNWFEKGLCPKLPVTVEILDYNGPFQIVEITDEETD